MGSVEVFQQQQTPEPGVVNTNIPSMVVFIILSSSFWKSKPMLIARYSFAISFPFLLSSDHEDVFRNTQRLIPNIARDTSNQPESREDEIQ